MSAAPVLSTEPEYAKVEASDRSRPAYSPEVLAQVYHIDDIATHIVTHGFGRPCLQFPDELVQDSTNVATAVERALDAQEKSMRVYVLADTSYSPCCVDEVAAQHINADVIFHFGNACLNPVRSIPVVYVMEELGTTDDIKKVLFEKITALGTSGTILYSDTQYTALLEELGQEFPELVLARPSRGLFIPAYEPSLDTGVSNSTVSEVLPNRVIPLEDPSSHKLIYLSAGAPSSSLLLHMSTVVSQIDVLDVSKADVPTVHINHVLTRRYQKVQAARTAGTVGILVNTLSLKYMIDVLDTVKQWIRGADKKFYTFVVGKPNVPKLANFEAIDVWVVLGCPLGGMIVDSQNYFKPIVTPHELHIALTNSGLGEWHIDFEQVLKLGDPNGGGDVDDEEDEEPMWDPATGRFVLNNANAPLRQVRHLDIGTDEQSLTYTSNSLTVRNTRSTAAEHLHTRSWRGLGTEHVEMTEEFAELKTGRAGIARDYGH